MTTPSAPLSPASPPSSGLTKPQIAALALGGAALVTLIGVASKSWLSAGSDGGLGLLGAEACRRGSCRSMGWSELKGAVSMDVVTFGYLGFILGLGAIGVTIASLVLTLQAKVAKIPVKVFNGIYGAAAFATTSFLIRLLMNSKLGPRASIGYSGFFAIGGLIATSFIIRKLVQPLAASEVAAPPHVADLTATPAAAL
jgi:hypothetical protein